MTAILILRLASVTHPKVVRVRVCGRGRRAATQQAGSDTGGYRTRCRRECTLPGTLPRCPVILKIVLIILLPSPILCSATPGAFGARLLKPRCSTRSTHRRLVAAFFLLCLRHSSTISSTGILVGPHHSSLSEQMVMRVRSSRLLISASDVASSPTPPSGPQRHPVPGRVGDLWKCTERV